MRGNMFGTGLMFAALAALAQPASAQLALPLELEVRGGAAFPVGEFGRGDSYSTGWGFEGNASLQVVPGIGVYGAYSRYAFPFDDDVLFGAGRVEGELVDQGFAGGAKLAVPLGAMGLSPWLRGGVIYHSAQFDYEGVENDPESDSALGYEIGGGLTFPLGMVVSVTPGIRYRSYAPDFGGGFGGGEDFDLSTVVADLGLSFRF